MSHTDENWRDLVRALHDRPDNSQETYGCAALAMTNKLLAEAVEFMHQNAKLLEKHAGRLNMLDEGQQGDAVDHESHRKRLDDHHDRLIAQRKRLDAMEEGRQTGMSAPPETQQATETPEPIGQAWVCLAGGQFWWDTLEPGGDGAAHDACIEVARKLFYPDPLPPGKAVLVNLVPVPVEPADEGKDASA